VGGNANKAAKEAVVLDPDKALLHGPQPPRDVNDQASIDRLFSDS
jgi:hypothetical protein